jgi:hypothetical protein
MKEYTVKDSTGVLMQQGSFEFCQKVIIDHVNAMGRIRTPRNFKRRWDMFDDEGQFVERDIYLRYITDKNGLVVGASLPRHRLIISTLNNDRQQISPPVYIPKEKTNIFTRLFLKLRFLVEKI